jgi:hypothetical protein
MAKWKTKLWEPDLFAALGDRILTEFSCQMIFTGSKEDRPVIENILSMMKNRALNFAGENRAQGIGRFIWALPGSDNDGYGAHAHGGRNGMPGGGPFRAHIAA